MKYPIGPAGTKVLVYENPQQRASYADNGVEGFYLGLAHNHYRCHKVWITSTRSDRTSDTLSWHIQDPFGLLSNHSPSDDIHCAIDALATAAQNASTPADKQYLQQGVDILLNLHASAVPRVVSDPTPSAATPTPPVWDPTPSDIIPTPLVHKNVNETQINKRSSARTVSPADCRS